METRNSNGLDQFCATLEERAGMAILDLAGANQSTVSFITDYGHRLYSDDFLLQLDRCFGEGDFLRKPDPTLGPARNSWIANSIFRMSTSTARWCGTYWSIFQRPLLQTVVERLHRMLRPGAGLLAFFHADERAETVPTYSYRIQDHRTIQMAPRGRRRPAQIFQQPQPGKAVPGFSVREVFSDPRSPAGSDRAPIGSR